MQMFWFNGTDRKIRTYDSILCHVIKSTPLDNNGYQIIAEVEPDLYSLFISK